MARILSSNIISPLGSTAEQNYQAVKSGCSALTRFEGKWNLPMPFAGSLFTDKQKEELHVEGFTDFESLVVHSVSDAISQLDMDLSSNRIALIISTTKGNIELLSQPLVQDEEEYIGTAAKRIANYFGITTEPIVVCNACISGVAVQILGQRLIDSGRYDYAIVVGAESISKFIVSGFQAFNAVTDEICRPFDIERLGLNLGEGAGTLILGKSDGEGWNLVRGAIRNDAYHLSAPHPQGEGYLSALKAIMGDYQSEEIATLGVHGTATMYNDQMESVAIQRAGLSQVPVTSLKGYYGHTMGAAGIIETILTLKAATDGLVLGAHGFEEIGVSGKINISPLHRSTNKNLVIKTLSGFGGCNGSVLYSQSWSMDKQIATPKIYPTHTLKITSDTVIIDDNKLETTANGKQLLKELYKSQIGDYPKFYKMDALTRLAFVASELMLKAEGSKPCCHRAVILFNRSSSIVADKQFMETIKDEENHYPSPSAFLYTLPNLTTGEIAIRNHYNAETSFYILPEKNTELMEQILSVSFMDEQTTSILGGWIDCPDEEHFEAELSIYTKLN